MLDSIEHLEVRDRQERPSERLLQVPVICANMVTDGDSSRVRVTVRGLGD